MNRNIDKIAIFVQGSVCEMEQEKTEGIVVCVSRKGVFLFHCYHYIMLSCRPCSSDPSFIYHPFFYPLSPRLYVIFLRYWTLPGVQGVVTFSVVLLAGLFFYFLLFQLSKLKIASASLVCCAVFGVSL